MYVVLWHCGSSTCSFTLTKPPSPVTSSHNIADCCCLWASSATVVMAILFTPFLMWQPDQSLKQEVVALRRAALTLDALLPPTPSLNVVTHRRTAIMLFAHKCQPLSCASRTVVLFSSQSEVLLHNVWLVYEWHYLSPFSFICVIVICLLLNVRPLETLLL